MLLITLEIKKYDEAYQQCHYEETEYAHFTMKKRTYIITKDIKWLETREWKNIKSIGICTREYIENGV